MAPKIGSSVDSLASLKPSVFVPNEGGPNVFLVYTGSSVDSLASLNSSVCVPNVFLTYTGDGIPAQAMVAAGVFLMCS